jgi:F-type H+-transporting ATPase subunit delta
VSVYRVATAYAKSLITLAQEIKVLDTVFEDMQLTYKVCSENRNLRNMLNSPVITSAKKIAIITEIFKGKVSDLSLKFFILISQKGREELLTPIASAFIDEYKILKGIQIASVVTAVEFDDKTKKKIAGLMSSITDKQVDVSYKVDESLIGGFILNTGGKQVDASVKSKLNSIKKQFNSNPYISKY